MRWTGWMLLPLLSPGGGKRAPGAASGMGPCKGKEEEEVPAWGFGLGEGAEPVWAGYERRAYDGNELIDMMTMVGEHGGEMKTCGPMICSDAVPQHGMVWQDMIGCQHAGEGHFVRCVRCCVAYMQSTRAAVHMQSTHDHAS